MKAIIKNQTILAEIESKFGKTVAYIQDGCGEDIIVFTDETVEYCFINLNWSDTITAEISLLDDENNVTETITIKL